MKKGCCGICKEKPGKHCVMVKNLLLQAERCFNFDFWVIFGGFGVRMDQCQMSSSFLE